MFSNALGFRNGFVPISCRKQNLLFQYVGMMLQGTKLLGIRELDGSHQAFSYNIYNVYVSDLTISDQVNKRLCINRVKISHVKLIVIGSVIVYHLLTSWQSMFDFM